jgi:hypothetical protein
MDWETFGKIMAAVLPIGGILILVGRKYELFSLGAASGKQLELEIQKIKLDLKDKPSFADCEKMRGRCGSHIQSDTAAKIDELKAMFREAESKRIAAKRDIEEWNKKVSKCLGKVEQFMVDRDSDKFEEAVEKAFEKAMKKFEERENSRG